MSHETEDRDTLIREIKRGRIMVLLDNYPHYDVDRLHEVLVAARDAVAELREEAAQVQRQTLIDTANDWTRGAWADTTWHEDRAADRIGAVQQFGDWLRARAAMLEQEETGDQ